MKRSALPFVIVLGGLAVLLLWAQCADRGIEQPKKVTASELKAVAEKVLPSLPPHDQWSGAAYKAVTRTALSGKARSLVDAVGTPKLKQLAAEGLVKKIESAADNPPKAVAHGSGIGEWVELQIAISEAKLALGDRTGALGALTTVAKTTFLAVGTAIDLDQMQAAEVVRLRFLNWVTRALQGGVWTKDEAAQIEKNCLAVSHREVLGATIQRRFMGDDIKQIAEASQTPDMKSAVSNALYDDPPEEVGKLLSVMLFRHPRVFNPSSTAQAGAESVKQLRDALEGPWDGSQKVLDLAAKVQALWTDFMDFLAKGDATAVAQIQGLKDRLSSTENPVGLALLHRERTSWSNLVQAAYAADSQEAQFRLAAMKAAGDDSLFDSVLDPLTGKPYRIDAEGAHTNLSDPGKNYPFVSALVGAPLKI